MLKVTPATLILMLISILTSILVPASTLMIIIMLMK